MRLINTESLQLHSFVGNVPPRYAILSHRWEGEETNFKDFAKGRDKLSAGYKKIARFCAQAAQEGYQWAWVDTCCIDKRSSAELSESINSMYRWYADSDKCYAYLSDVVFLGGLGTLTKYKEGFGLKRSRWFTRGWTLQELLAPRSVVFLDRDWNRIGTKASLSSPLSEITSISERFLRDVLDPMRGDSQSCSIAEKMSWAANRETARIEDTAYCLLGLFNINMPLLYGEREKAFLRLQEEIIKTSGDMSVFAWGSPSDRGARRATSDTENLFARNPKDFFHSGKISGHLHTIFSSFETRRQADRWRRLGESLHDSLYTMTHKGLQIDAHFSSSSDRNLGVDVVDLHSEDRLLILDCGKEVLSPYQGDETYVCLLQIRPSAARTVETSRQRDWIRANDMIYFLRYDELSRKLSSLERRTIYIQV